MLDKYLLEFKSEELGLLYVTSSNLSSCLLSVCCKAGALIISFNSHNSPKRLVPLLSSFSDEETGSERLNAFLKVTHRLSKPWSLNLHVICPLSSLCLMEERRGSHMGWLRDRRDRA